MRTSPKATTLTEIKNPKLITQDGSLRNISTEEQITVNALFKQLNTHANVLYRGIEARDTIDRFIICDAGTQNFREVIPEIFYFGLKSKNLLQGSNFNYADIRTSTTLGVLSLCKSTSNLMKSNKRAIISEFAAQNPEFFNFFKTIEEQELYEKVNTLSYSQRRILRDLLITILHREGENDYSPMSLLVSTSSCYARAEKFIEFDEGGIVILWTPKKHRNFIVSAHKNSENLSSLQACGFPPAQSMPNDHEHETSVFGAIFPHYIFGIYSKAENFTYINPAVLAVNRDCQYWITNGLSINQTHFIDLQPKKTKNKSYANHENNETTILDAQPT